MSEDEIAARLNLTLDIVKAGVAGMEAYRQTYSHEIVDMKVNEVVIGQLEGMSHAFADGLAAMRLLNEVGPNGEPIFAIDHRTRIEMIGAISELIDKVRPRTGAGVAVNILNQNNNANVAGGGGRSFEARVRNIREKRGMNVADGAVTVAEEDEADEDVLEGDPIDDEDIDDEVEPDYPEEH